MQNIHKLGVDDLVALSCRTTMPAKTMQYRLTLHKASLIHIIPSADGHRLQRLIKVDSLDWRQAQHSYTKLLPTWTWVIYMAQEIPILNQVKQCSTYRIDMGKHPWALTAQAPQIEGWQLHGRGA